MIDSLPGFSGEPTSFTTNSIGFRGEELKDGELKVFALGGSTTECIYLDDDEHWPHLLQQYFREAGMKINVQNAGKSGDAIDDHIAMTAHRLIHLEPDVIIIYMGINDVFRLVCNRNPLKYDVEKDHLPVFKHCLSETQLYRRLHNILSENGGKQQIGFESDYKDKVAYSNSFPLSDSVPSIDTAYFRKKVELLFNICKNASDATIYLIPQLTTWETQDTLLKKHHWMNEICGTRYRQNILADFMDELNKIITKTCVKHGINVVPVKIAPISDYFYDDCHFNPKGAELFAQQLHNYMKENIQIDTTHKGSLRAFD